MSPPTNRTSFRVLKEQLAKLYKLRDESIVRKIADWEYEKGCIGDVLENIDEARVQFEVCQVIIVRRHWVSIALCNSFALGSGRSKLCMRWRRASE